MHTINIKRCESDHKNSKTSIFRAEERELMDAEENKEINEKSIQIEITQEELSEYSSYYDNKEFLISTQISCSITSLMIKKGLKLTSN